MHQFDHVKKDLQGSDVSVETIPEVDVLHLARSQRTLVPVSWVGADAQSHLHGDGGPIPQLRLMNLSQAGCSEGLMVKGFKELLGGFAEILLEESLHLLQAESPLPSEFPSVELRSRPWTDLFVSPVQGLVFQHLQGADVLGG